VKALMRVQLRVQMNANADIVRKRNINTVVRIDIQVVPKKTIDVIKKINVRHLVIIKQLLIIAKMIVKMGRLF
jgi:hypothetical protein